MKNLNGLICQQWQTMEIFCHLLSQYVSCNSCEQYYFYNPAFQTRYEQCKSHQVYFEENRIMASNARVIRCISKKTELWPWENNAWLKTIQFIEENKNSPTGTGLGGVVGGKVGGGGGASENQLRSVNKEFSHIATDLLQQR